VQPHTAQLNAGKGSTTMQTKYDAQARNAQAAQARKPALTATSMANSVVAENQQHKAATTQPVHQPWYHWFIP
jgi:hypothetical protein